MDSDRAVVDYVGVGIGPANLSLAALAEGVPQLTGLSFDKKKEFRWHPGLMLEGATIQVSPVKDLVTLVDPTNPSSFLAYLAHHKRLYRFLTAGFDCVLRAEYDDYFRWASKRLPGLHFGNAVDSVEFLDGPGVFEVTTSSTSVRTRNVVLGVGLAPATPEQCRPHLGPTMIHASDYLNVRSGLAGKNVLVVGGGQTGAEIFLDLLNLDGSGAGSVTWASRRSNFLPLDDSPFINELFFPNYIQHFFALPEDMKSTLLNQQTLASDGIDMDTLNKVYKRLYEIQCLHRPGPTSSLMPGHELGAVVNNGQYWQVDLRNSISGAVDAVTADVVILCTGYRFAIPSFLDPVRDRLATTNDLLDIDENYAVHWDGPRENRIYLQNGARHTRGIADPNLSLLSWRSAKILNDILGYPLYDTESCDSAIDWEMQKPATSLSEYRGSAA
ncbi:lysine N6-hydroxylase [Herbihabitans rhizosphaerae]|uniref:L-lysine N6-monooxygenase MbtG n=1 Tax=Herbihabitans rhizosphaerae TaxID=1872711 RepID=A0A4Q7KH65_9PSEU|nr:SidA/IucD/PvdA family monooxygenase [Herbihabitans rhizosphaerae]RZS34221.1 lysine N6-hydroxylase [Herbihabitans rhizosphaerae]